jgi:hypothetical protein
MIVCAHRINTIEQLDAVHPSLGIEFDVREASRGNLVVTHDPWKSGPNLDFFLSQCRHAFYIVNIKCEGIEYAVLELLQKYGITNFFLLDCTFPMIMKLSRADERRIALRVSDYEMCDKDFFLQKKCLWIWMDCFQNLVYGEKDCQSIHDLGYKICLVSPELQGQPEKLQAYKDRIGKYIDMVCTKFPDQWLDDTSRKAIEQSQQLPSL